MRVPTPSVTLSAEGSSFSPGRAQFHSSISCTSTTPNLTWLLMMTHGKWWWHSLTLHDPRPQSLNIITCFIFSHIKIFLPATSATLKRGEWKAAAMDDTKSQPVAVVDAANRAWKAGRENSSPSKDAGNVRTKMKHTTLDLARILGFDLGVDT